MALPIAIRTITVGTFTPPRPVTTIYGSSQPGLPEMTPGSSSDMSRSYSVSQMGSPAQPAGMPCSLSVSGTYFGLQTALAAATSKSAAACQTMINAFLPGGNLRDDADHLFSPCHEPDNNGFSQAQVTEFAQAHVNFAKFCWPTIKAAYTHNVTWGPIFTGAWYGSGPDKGGLTRSDSYRDNWLAGYTPDWIGSDPYANLALLGLSASYAAKKSLPWAITEFGTQANGGAISTDAQHKAHMVSAITTTTGLTNPPFAFLYWPSGENVLWAKLVTATSAGATSITVARSSEPGTIGPGQIIIDPHGAHPETVTTIGSIVRPSGPSASPSGDDDCTYQVPALSFPHSANVAVWLMPQAVQYWRSIS